MADANTQRPNDALMIHGPMTLQAGEAAPTPTPSSSWDTKPSHPDSMAPVAAAAAESLAKPVRSSSTEEEDDDVQTVEILDTPRRKEKGGRILCRVVCCKKWAQSGNDGFCRTHYHEHSDKVHEDGKWTCDCGKILSCSQKRCSCLRWKGGKREMHPKYKPVKGSVTPSRRDSSGSRGRKNTPGCSTGGGKTNRERQSQNQQQIQRTEREALLPFKRRSARASKTPERFIARPSKQGFATEEGDMLFLVSRDRSLEANNTARENCGNATDEKEIVEIESDDGEEEEEDVPLAQHRLGSGCSERRNARERVDNNAPSFGPAKSSESKVGVHATAAGIRRSQRRRRSSVTDSESSPEDVETVDAFNNSNNGDDNDVKLQSSDGIIKLIDSERQHPHNTTTPTTKRGPGRHRKCAAVEATPGSTNNLEDYGNILYSKLETQTPQKRGRSTSNAIRQESTPRQEMSPSRKSPWGSKSPSVRRSSRESTPTPKILAITQSPSDKTLPLPQNSAKPSGKKRGRPKKTISEVGDEDAVNLTGANVITELKSANGIHSAKAEKKPPTSNVLKKKRGIKMGCVVAVARRPWLDVHDHREGGVARVVGIHNKPNATIIYDLSYIFGGHEKGVDESFVALHEPPKQTGTNGKQHAAHEQLERKTAVENGKQKPSRKESKIYWRCNTCGDLVSPAPQCSTCRHWHTNQSISKTDKKREADNEGQPKKKCYGAEITRNELLRGRDFWICVHCNIGVPSLSMPCGGCHRKISNPPCEAKDLEHVLKKRRLQEQQRNERSAGSIAGEKTMQCDRTS